jgi:hypothetical protein
MKGRNLGYGTKNGAMLRNQLKSVRRAAQSLLDELNDQDEVPEWVLTKVATAMDRLVTADNYITSKLEGYRPNPRMSVQAAITNAQKVKRELRQL